MWGIRYPVENRRQTPNHTQASGDWVSLGVYDLVKDAGHKVQLSERADGRVIADAIRLRPVVGDERFASWQGTVAAAGDYHVLARWPEGADLAPNAKFTLTYPGGTATAIRDQSRGGGAWHLLKTVTLAANDNWRVDLSDKAAGPVAADAVSLVPVGTLPGFTWAPTLPAAGTWQVFAKWPALAGLARDAVYEVVHADGTESIRVSQRESGSDTSFAFAPQPFSFHQRH